MKILSGLFFLLTINSLSAQVSFIKEFPAFLDSIAYLNAVSWVDVDNDNDLDVCVSGSKGTFPDFICANEIFVNEGNGVFSKTGLINSQQKNAMRHGWADFDNDGDLDVYIGATWNSNGINELWVNNGGTSFTSNSTTGSTPNIPQPYEGTISWADYNNDGWADLYIVRWNDLKNRLFKNNGNGSFTEITNGQVVNDLAWSSGAFWGDYDNDRDQDLYVVNYQKGASSPGVNDLFRNNGDGSFTKITGAGTVVTDAQNSRSANWADVDNDGFLDLFVCNQFGQDILHRNLGNGTFDAKFIGPANHTSWSSNWGDYDNDGDQDLITIGFWGADSQFWQNDGKGNLTNITSSFPEIFPTTTNGSNSNGIIFVDENIDGWLDIHITQPGPESEDFFFRNLGSGCKSWLEIKLTGTISNRAAIGATIRAKTIVQGQAIWQMRQVSSQTSATGQNPIWQHFGFDNAQIIDSLIVEWPSGKNCIFTQFIPNKLVEISEECEVEILKTGQSPKGTFNEVLLCYPAEDTLLKPPSGAGGVWSSDCIGCIDTNGIFKASDLGAGAYLLFYKNGGLCGTVDTIALAIIGPPILTVSNDTSVTKGSEVNLSAKGALNIVWEPSMGLSCNFCSNPFFTADTTTTFIVTGINSIGCQSKDSIKITVLPEFVFEIPNTFTPNGDGRNDLFKPVFKGKIFSEFSLTIYNRWGQEVFSTTQPDEAWKGENAPSDVYVYILDYKLMNGAAGKKKGDITLIR